MNNSWNSNIIEILENVRVNAVNLSEYHRRNYFYYKSLSNYFDIPIIIISTIAGSFSVGADQYLKQNNISLISCLSSMTITILGSIKLYLNISQNLENESSMAREFYVLSVEIFKMISLPTNQRNSNGIEFLNSKYSQYIKLYEESNLLKVKYKKDTLTKIDKNLIAEFNIIKSNSSSMSSNEDGDPSPSPKHPSLDRIRNLNPLSITINE
jgi:hypothetical protein